MSFIDLMADVDWSEADIQNRQRNVVASLVPQARQDELRTIMIGHIMGLRQATSDELAEVQLIKDTTEAAYVDTLAARADMDLLRRTKSLEAAQARLAAPPVDPVTDDAGNVLNQDELSADSAERASAQSAVDAAAQDARDLAATRAAARAQPTIDTSGVTV